MDTSVVIDECVPSNAAGLDEAATRGLMAGSGNAGNLRFLNPYDRTVFPRGLIAPLMMWDGAPADAVYVHIFNSTFDYKGCFLPTGPNQLQLPQGIWDQAGEHAGGPNDPFTIELNASSSGAVTGPVTEQVIIAKANLKGSIYYNTYSPQTGTPLPGAGGAIMRIQPGQPAQMFLGMSGCTGCHSVSANGARMSTLNFPLGGATYELAQGTPPNPPAMAPAAPETSFTGLYPDGSLYVSNAHMPMSTGVGVIGPRTGPTNFGTANAGLYETDSGILVQNSGVPAGAMTPTFSPDGSLLAFTDFAINDSRGLALMNFDIGSRTATDYRQVYASPDTRYPAWPFVLPDDKGLVFALGDQADFSGGGSGLGLGAVLGIGAISDLYIIDLESGEPRMLAQAMGFASEQDAASDNTYLPFGSEELHHNYYPTVSPVAAGGYFWAFFDSVRHYGNIGLARELWGTAISISPNGTYRSDPSNPPFYVTGQQLGTGNHRAFTALDPCKQDGDTCSTGVDCCAGFCTDGTCNPPPPPPPDDPPPCAKTDESCASVACCNPDDLCIAGFCGEINVPR